MILREQGFGRTNSWYFDPTWWVAGYAWIYLFFRGWVGWGVECSPEIRVDMREFAKLCMKTSTLYPPWNNHFRAWKLMLGRRSFLFGKRPNFRTEQTVSLRKRIIYCSPFYTLLQGPGAWKSYRSIEKKTVVFLTSESFFWQSAKRFNYSKSY